MDQAAEILVIIVSSVLSVFLIVAIILGIYLIKLTAEIRRLAKSASDTVSHIDNAVVGVSRLTSPIFIAEMVNRYIKKFTSKTKKGKKDV
ncbi:hypothetical protein BGO17_01305 [Candidatus Saccharibacteria bacterium 49-20]|nr:MAG: hypothetical protein BGO17_01305 [Candidatus Saccharibacteria bacterium 49-20]